MAREGRIQVEQPMLPSDDVAERNVLGTIMNNDGMLATVEDILTTDMFSTSVNKALYRILKYVIKGGQVVDEGSIMACAEKFKAKIGVDVEEVRLVLLETAICDSQRTFMQDVERLADYGMRRKAWDTLQVAASKVLTLTEDADDVMVGAMRSLDGIRGNTRSDDGIIDAQKAVRMVYDQINDNLQGTNRSCVKTGFRFSDAKGGLRLGSLVVIGAWTSVGKTSLALNIATNVAMSGTPVAYYSLEMGAVELWSRIISSHTSVSAGKILNYPLKREEVDVIDRSMDWFGRIPLYIDDKATTTFPKMIRSVRTMVRKYKVRLFVVDYLQIFAQNGKGGNEESLISSMARELKNVCRELDVCCVCLSQLRRNSDERHPTIDMLRGSGQIEESSDVVLLIDRPEAHPEWGVQSFYGNSKESIVGKAELRVSKGRNIGLGTYYVGFDAQKTTFYELDGYSIGDEIGYDGEVTRQDEPSERAEDNSTGTPF